MTFQRETLRAIIARLTDDEVSTFTQRCRAHPTAGYFDVKLVRVALEKLFGVWP